MSAKIQHIGLVTGPAVEDVATFYKEVFGMTEVSTTSLFWERSGIFISDGNINLACLAAPHHPVGRLHFGFKVDSVEETFAMAEKCGGSVGDRERPKDGRYAEASVLDPVGTSVDVAASGWRQSQAMSKQPIIQHIGLAAGNAVEAVATFYKEVFGMTEVSTTSNYGPRSGIFLSDGAINLACLTAPRQPVGRLHFGFKVQDIDQQFAAVEKFGGDIGDRERPKDGRYAEASVLDPVGTSVDLAVNGWKNGDIRR